MNASGEGGAGLYLPARCGDRTFAVAAASALAVLRLEGLTLAHGAPAHVMGIANTRFGVVAVISLARWLDPSASTLGLASLAVVVERGADIVALAVDEFAEAFVARQEDIASVLPRQGASPPPGSSGALKLGSEIVPILDLASLFDSQAEAGKVPLGTSKGSEP